MAIATNFRGPSLDTEGFTELGSTPERYTEFTGQPDVEKFNNEAKIIKQEAEQTDMTPAQKILLDIQMNAIYGHSIEQSNTLKGVFGAIAGAISLVPVKLKNKTFVWGNISDRGGNTDIPTYRMPRIG